ncbi:Pao retrotransposon peptidase family protein, partial [Aphelenchoides avenae]
MQQQMQQQAQQQQNIMLKCLRQQEASQQVIVQTLTALIQGREDSEDSPETSESSHTVVRTGDAERVQNTAPNPGGTTEPTDGYDNFASTRGSGFPPPRGGFGGRGRGGTPITSVPHPATPPQPAVQQFKLPEPEPFKGEFQDWPRFWEEWTHYISQTQPDDFSKTRLIKKLLQGPAREVTQCYRDTAADYTSLTDALKRRYDRPEAVVGFLQKKLIDIKAPERESAGALRTLHTQIEAVLRQLSDAGEEINTRFYRSHIEQKLPTRLLTFVIVPIKRACTKEEWTIRKRLDVLETHILDLEEVVLTRELQPAGTARDSGHPRRVHTLQTDPYGFRELEDDTEVAPRPASSQCKVKGKLCYMRDCKGKSAKERDHQPLLCRLAFPVPKDAKQEKIVHLAGREHDTKADASDEGEATDSHSGYEREPYDYGSDPPTDMEDSDDDSNYTCVAHKEETNMAIGGAKRTLMMTVKADVSHVSDKSRRKLCNVFFDGGSSATLITKEQARELALPILKRVNTTFQYYGSPPEGRREVVWKVQFRIHCSDGTDLVLHADAVDHLCNPLPSLPLKEGTIVKVLRSIQVRPEGPVEVAMEAPQILIGLDQMHLFGLAHRKQLPNGFSLYSSRLGNILCGRGPTTSHTEANDSSQTINCVFREPTVNTISNVPARTNAVSEIITKRLELQAIERLASLEGIGIEAPGKVNEEELVLQRHKESLTRLPDGRYEVSFPYRDEILSLQQAGVPPHLILPTNYKPAVARLTSVWKSHLKDNPQGRKAYSDTFDVQLTREIIEEVDKTLRIGDCDRLVHYLAHHPVFRADKPTQLRIVFDGSARSGPGTCSLNDCLHPGPSMLESLIGILLRSRGAQILIIGDIEKAFLQISLREEDRDVTRFLWLKDPAKPPTPYNIVVYRYKRIPFGLNASPFLLLATIEHHLKQVDSAVSREIRQNTYSDNVFLLAHTPEDCVQKYKETKLIFSDMKMNIREFISNSPQFNEAIPEEDRAKQTKEATLGHEWDSKKDVWTFRLPEPNPFKRDLEASAPAASNTELVHTAVEAEHVMVSRKVKSAKVMTKRVMLSILHGLWDPLNFLCPLTLQARLVHQELWAQEPKLKWDVPVPETFIKLWDDATSTWSGFTFEIERHMFSDGKPASLQLHVFVDASGDGYGGVAYLRVTSTSGKTYARLVYARNRVKCRKPALTIPRKELLAALIGCRMVTFLRKEMLPELQRLHQLGDVPVYLWGDNQGVLYWIKDSSHVYMKFVQNRLSEIRLTANVSFRYVPTKDNPPDVLSRGATTYELKSHTLWWHGAPWLAEDETQWPEQPSDFQPYSDDIAGNDGKVVDVHVVTRKEDRQALTPLLELLAAAIPKTVRTYSRMRRVLTVVVRFAGQLTAKRWKRNLRLPFLSPFSPTHTINVSEAYLCLLQYKASELMLVWEAQQAHPPTPAQASQFNVET